MELLEGILSRRSIRQYKPDLVSEEQIQKLLEAAMSAPSAGNEQPWQFVVINDRKVLGAIPTIHPHSQMLEEAPLAILVCGDLELAKFQGYWVQDCAAATENVLLAAHALGLGTVWLGVYPDEERIAGLRRLLALPEHVLPMALVAVGHSDEIKLPAHRYKPERIHYNGW